MQICGQTYNRGKSRYLQHYQTVWVLPWVFKSQKSIPFNPKGFCKPSLATGPNVGKLLACLQATPRILQGLDTDKLCRSILKCSSILDKRSKPFHHLGPCDEPHLWRPLRALRLCTEEHVLQVGWLREAHPMSQHLVWRCLLQDSALTYTHGVWLRARQSCHGVVPVDSRGARLIATIPLS